MQTGRKAVSENIKWQIIVKSKNHTNVEIGKLVGVPEFCVQKKGKTSELTDDTNMLCSRIPSELSDHDKSSIFRTSKENPRLINKKLAQIFNQFFSNQNVS